MARSRTVNWALYRRWSVWAIVAVVIVMACDAQAADVGGGGHRYRVSEQRRFLFDEDFSWVTREGADRLLEAMDRSGFNALVVCVWHRRGVSWPSKLRTAGVEDRWGPARRVGDDPLEYLIARAHERGIEVHAWFTVSLRQRDIFPDLSDPVRTSDGTPVGMWLNPHREGFAAVMAEIVVDVVARYPVDGVNLDYVRTGGVCVSEFCQSRYAAEVGRNLLVDASRARRDPGSWRSIQEWNTTAVTRVIRAIVDGVHRISPKVMVSVDARIGRAKNDFQGAAAVAWANAGLVDLVFQMDYDVKPDVVAVSAARDSLTSRGKFVLLVGNFERTAANGGAKVVPRAPADVARLVALSREMGSPDGALALYTFRFLTLDQQRAVGDVLGVRSPRASGRTSMGAGSVLSLSSM